MLSRLTYSKVSKFLLFPTATLLPGLQKNVFHPRGVKLGSCAELALVLQTSGASVRPPHRKFSSST